MRIAGYTEYSDWLQYGEGGLNPRFNGSISSDYKLGSHTRGLDFNYANQLTDKHLLNFTFSYVTSNTFRNNDSGIASAGAAVAYLVDSTNPTSGVCYSAALAPVNCTGASTSRYSLPAASNTGTRSCSAPAAPDHGARRQDLRRRAVPVFHRRDRQRRHLQHGRAEVHDVRAERQVPGQQQALAGPRPALRRLQVCDAEHHRRRRAAALRQQLQPVQLLRPGDAVAGHDHAQRRRDEFHGSGIPCNSATLGDPRFTNATFSQVSTPCRTTRSCSRASG